VTVNTKATGATVIIDPCARFWVTTALGYRIVSSTGITIPAIVTVGSEATTYQNVYGSSTSGFEPNGALTGIIWVPLENGYISYADLTTSGLRVNVQVAATGTSQSVEIIVVGYYV
jgi:hypothetical protein